VNLDMRSGRTVWLMVLAGLLVAPLAADPVAVRYAEGLVHGYLVLKALDGRVIADGEQFQIPRGDRLTSKTVFRFRDGSTHEETVVFSQRGRFRLLTDHVVQKGPAFRHPLDMSIDARARRVSVRYKDGNEEKVHDERMDLPADLANGLIPVLLKNLPRGAAVTLPFVAATPKPRLVKLEIGPPTEESFTVGRATYKAAHWILKVEIGGLKGAIAPIVGKQPPDNHVWTLISEAPAFVKSEAPFYAEGPVWRIELASPAPSR
jgi:hypothetical protein